MYVNNCIPPFNHTDFLMVYEFCDKFEKFLTMFYLLSYALPCFIIFHYDCHYTYRDYAGGPPS